MHIQTRIDAVTLTQAYVALGRTATSISDLVRECVRRVAASGTDVLEGQTEHELKALQAKTPSASVKVLADVVSHASAHPRLAEALAGLDGAEEDISAPVPSTVNEQAAQLPQEETP